MVEYGRWKCAYCGNSNGANRRYCGEGTVNGCGGVQRQHTAIPIAGIMMSTGEEISFDDCRLPKLRGLPEFAEVLFYQDFGDTNC